MSIEEKVDTILSILGEIAEKQEMLEKKILAIEENQKSIEKGLADLENQMPPF